MNLILQTAGQPIAGAATSVAFTLAQTPNIGNLLVAFCAYSQFQGPRTIATPVGWTKVDDQTNAFDSLAVFWHVVTLGDGTNYTFNISGSTEHTSGALYVVSGANAIAPINKFAAGTFTGNPTSVTTASVTPSVLNTLALVTLTADNAGDSFTSISAGYTEQITEQGDYHQIYSASRNSLTSDISTAINATFTFTSAGSDFGISEIILIAPALTDSKVPQATIRPQPLNTTALDGYPSALFDDPVYTFDDSRVLFGSQTTAIADMKLHTAGNNPDVSGKPVTVRSGTAVDAPRISSQHRR